MTSWQRQRLKKKDTPVLHPTTSCHAWNKDRTQIALSANDSNILIYSTKGSEDFTKWELIHTLTEHGKIVTCLSWAPRMNRILSCSQDRNAYVWTLEDGVWMPVLVLLRIKRAATCCAWSAQENKFAVGSGQKLVSVCHFDPDNNWWVSKVTKKGKHRSTVMSVAFHPTDNTMLLTGCADFKCRYFSAFIKRADKKEEKRGVLGKDFGEWSSKGWVLSVAFSPNGKWIAFVGHDSTLTVAELENPDNFSVIHHKGLPLNSLLFLSDNAITAAGHDNSPILFGQNDGKWEYIGDLEASASSDKKKAAPKKQTTGRFGGSRFGPSKFGGSKSSSSSSSGSTSANRRHKMAIAELKAYSQDNNGCTTKFTSCGLDGRILFWDASKFSTKFPKFQLK